MSPKVGTSRRGIGNAGKGRKKGSVNKATASIKAAFVAAFEELGGAPSLAEWGRENETEFYKLAARLIPTEIQGDVQAALTIRVVKE